MNYIPGNSPSHQQPPASEPPEPGKPTHHHRGILSRRPRPWWCCGASTISSQTYSLDDRNIKAAAVRVVQSGWCDGCRTMYSPTAADSSLRAVGGRGGGGRREGGGGRRYFLSRSTSTALRTSISALRQTVTSHAATPGGQNAEGKWLSQFNFMSHDAPQTSASFASVSTRNGPFPAHFRHILTAKCDSIDRSEVAFTSPRRI